tara:strand:+ start:1341 stop:1700 length:360 start_codon:yes stop_codon:yes gene_type:complete
MLTNLLFIGIGGSLGAISRYGVNEFFVNYLSISTNAGTLFVNVLGCFVIGILFGFSLPVKDTTYYFFAIGFLGSFTTMSAFTYQIVIMANSNLINALSYIMLTLILTILATYIGAMISK